jgi:hypothetical protein
MSAPPRWRSAIDVRWPEKIRLLEWRWNKWLGRRLSQEEAKRMLAKFA